MSTAQRALAGVVRGVVLPEVTLVTWLEVMSVTWLEKALSGSMLCACATGICAISPQ